MGRRGSPSTTRASASIRNESTETKRQHRRIANHMRECCKRSAKRAYTCLASSTNVAETACLNCGTVCPRSLMISSAHELCTRDSCASREDATMKCMRQPWPAMMHAHECTQYSHKLSIQSHLWENIEPNESKKIPCCVASHDQIWKGGGTHWEKCEKAGFS